MSERKFSEKIYTDFDAYDRDWIAAFRRAGHAPKLDDGEIDYFAYSPHDPHNGPRCTKCGEGWCMHCTPPWRIVEQKCGGRAHRLKVQRQREDAVLKEAAEIRQRRRSKLRSSHDHT